MNERIICKTQKGTEIELPIDEDIRRLPRLVWDKYAETNDKAWEKLHVIITSLVNGEVKTR